MIGKWNEPESTCSETIRWPSYTWLAFCLYIYICTLSFFIEGISFFYFFITITFFQVKIIGWDSTIGRCRHASLFVVLIVIARSLYDYISFLFYLLFKKPISLYMSLLYILSIISDLLLNITLRWRHRREISRSCSIFDLPFFLYLLLKAVI